MKAKPIATAALTCALAALTCAALTAPAGAAVVRHGVLQATFSGGIAPLRLPRSTPAPVTVRMGGKIRTTDRSTPPKLEKIVLQINANGIISTAGLPTCPLGKLNSVPAQVAKRSCGGALIGHGNVTSRISLPGQGPFASNGQLLAFNGLYRHRPAVFAQVTTAGTLPLTYVIVFEVKKTKGTFGTELIGALPPIASEYGYISAFDLSLARRYRSHGRSRSYASASCPAPKGFSEAPSFAFARASYLFEGGISLSSVLQGTCLVRGG